jgi:hypothetical protein
MNNFTFYREHAGEAEIYASQFVNSVELIFFVGAGRKGAPEILNTAEEIEES